MRVFYDSVELGDRRETADGYLVADVRFARTGIQVYRGSELGRPDLAEVRVFRSEDEVFSDEAMASFAHRPVTNDHPPVMVSSKNWNRFAKGHTDAQVARDGQYVRVAMMVSDGDTIAAIAAGKRELSAGYTCDVDFAPGVTPTGEAYDAKQVNIRGNHVAVVARGRAGSHCRVGDAAPTDNEDTTPMKTIIIDGVAVEVSDAAVAEIAKLQASVATAISRVSAKDGELDALKASHQVALDAEKAKVLTGSALDAAIVSRSALLDAARAVLGAKTDFAGKSDADIRRTAVVAKLGAARVEGRDDAYVAAAFDVLCTVPAAGGRDPIRDALANGGGAPGKRELSPYEQFVADMAGAHQADEKTAA